MNDSDLVTSTNPRYQWLYEDYDPNITVALGDTIVCDELVKAIEGVTTNGKTKLQQG